MLCREDLADDKRLVAYIVTSRKPSPAVEELRLFLLEQLPSYMVPSFFVFLDAMPVTPNGKIDRRALPAPERQRPDLAARFELPQTEIERSIAYVWQEVLGIEKVGLHDNFFDLGGHSLLLAAVYDNLREILESNTGFSIISMFQYPTVSGLANFLSQKPSGKKIESDREKWVGKLNAGKKRLAQLQSRRQTVQAINQKGIK